MIKRGGKFRENGGVTTVHAPVISGGGTYFRLVTGLLQRRRPVGRVF
jgi:hypothetical protein